MHPLYISPGKKSTHNFPLILPPCRHGLFFIVYGLDIDRIDALNYIYQYKNIHTSKEKRHADRTKMGQRLG